MGRVVLILVCLILFSCTSGKHEVKTNDKNPIVINLQISLQQYKDSTDYYKGLVSQRRDSVILVRDKALYLLDSLQRAKDVSDYKLSRINYYIDICASRETNKKYLYGWVRRALGK